MRDALRFNDTDTGTALHTYTVALLTAVTVLRGLASMDETQALDFMLMSDDDEVPADQVCSLVPLCRVRSQKSLCIVLSALQVAGELAVSLPNAVKIPLYLGEHARTCSCLVYCVCFCPT